MTDRDALFKVGDYVEIVNDDMFDDDRVRSLPPLYQPVHPPGGIYIVTDVINDFYEPLKLRRVRRDGVISHFQRLIYSYDAEPVDLIALLAYLET